MTVGSSDEREPALLVEDIVVRYGPIPALRGVSMRVAAGGVTAVLGANGAGKTTLIRAISGLLRPDRGRIRLFDRDTVGAQPHEIAALGLGVVPEGRRVFPRLTVEENLGVGLYVGRLPPAERRRRVEEQFVRFPILRERRRQEAGTLSGGEQQMLAIARALVARPRLLVLDEPSLGLAPRIVSDLFIVVEEIQRSKATVLLIEQSVRFARRVAQHAFVMAAGRVVSELDGDRLRDDAALRAAYLGESA